MTRAHRGDELAAGDWAVLACVAERPAHGFAVATRLAPDGDLGRVVTVSRPLTYRAIERLLARSLVEVVGEERGRNGLTRTVYAATAAGRDALGEWLGAPVTAPDDLAVDFVLKVVVLVRLGLDDTDLLARQREVLTTELAMLDGGDEENDPVDLWHEEAARAAVRFVDRLARTPHPAHGVAPDRP